MQELPPLNSSGPLRASPPQLIGHYPDPRFRAPRIWSNRELRRLAPLFKGTVVNVSAWRDEDKEGRQYRDYFTAASEYSLTNYRTEARGWQEDLEQQIFLDLEQPLPRHLVGAFDVVFNHTTLEHVFEIFTAFGNLCGLAREAVIVVVPFMQEQHAEYGDYWRFTPTCVRRLFSRSGWQMAYVNFNEGQGDAIYVLAIGVRDLAAYPSLAADPWNRLPDLDRTFIGRRGLRNEAPLARLLEGIARLFGR